MDNTRQVQKTNKLYYGIIYYNTYYNPKICIFLYDDRKSAEKSFKEMIEFLKQHKVRMNQISEKGYFDSLPDDNMGNDWDDRNNDYTLATEFYSSFINEAIGECYRLIYAVNKEDLCIRQSGDKRVLEYRHRLNGRRIRIINPKESEQVCFEIPLESNDKINPEKKRVANYYGNNVIFLY